MRADSELHSLQFIATDGDKRFLTGGRVAGCYYSLGTIKGATSLCITEGFATGATIYEATGHPVAVGFSAGNLVPVALALRAKYPDLDLILCADNDVATHGNPGLTQATAAAQAVGGRLTIPDFGAVRPDGATDFNDLHNAQGLGAVGLAVAGAVPPPKNNCQPNTNEEPSGNSESAVSGSKPSTAMLLIELAVANCDLFHDERDNGHAVAKHNDIRLTLKLRSKEFRRWLAGSYYAATNKAANNDAISTALSVLEAKATFDGPQLELSNRFAMRDGVIYIDLADDKWCVVKVTATGWEIMDKPPVLFRRYPHQKSLPDPVRGGKLSSIHKHLAIKSDEEKLLLEAVVVASAFSNVPRPAITFHGPQGASKTTSARILKSITDPSLTESVDLGKSPADLAQVLDHHGVPCFDNLTSIPSWAADMLCRAVTGGAFSKRELYSDDSDILLTFKRLMIITGINIPTHAPDLLDRLLLIELERIQPEKRVDETTFWKNFEEDRPTLFGALLDGIVGALKHLPGVKLDRMPRMADFARVACAYAEHTGVGAERMLSIIMQHSSRQIEEILEADPVASAIREFIEKEGRWTGTASQLLHRLNESQPTRRSDGWPKQGNSLSRKLNVLHATLNDVGITLRRAKEGSKRILTLEISPDSSSISSLSSRANVHADFEVDDMSRPSSLLNGNGTHVATSSESSSTINPCVHMGLDDTDDKDDISAPFSGDVGAKSVVERTI